jgi:hypothetical protein
MKITHHLNIINTTAKVINARTYLEIGVCTGSNINNVRIGAKTGVDVNDIRGIKEGIEMIKSSSDDFFRTNERKFDLIFIDGDHSQEQSMKDFENALKCVSNKGLILLHDVYPPNLKHMELNLCGGVYLNAQDINNRFKCVVFPYDYGVMIVNPRVTKNKKTPIFEGNDFLEIKDDVFNYGHEVRDISNLITEDKKSFDLYEKSDEEIKDIHQEVFGNKPKGRYIRENVIAKIEAFGK